MYMRKIESKINNKSYRDSREFALDIELMFAKYVQLLLVPREHC
jgi:hypothetical protein